MTATSVSTISFGKNTTILRAQRPDREPSLHRRVGVAQRTKRPGYGAWDGFAPGACRVPLRTNSSNA